MTCTCKLALALLLTGGLAACGASGPAAAPRQPSAHERNGDPGAEAAWAHMREAGATDADFAPFNGEKALREGDLAAAHKWLGEAHFAPGVAAYGYQMLGRLRMREGDLAGAGKAFDRALQGLGRDSSLWVDIARLRYLGGEQAQAVEASKKALAFGPANPAALLLRAQLTRDALGNAASLPLFERGVQAAPKDPDLLADYAATLGELGRTSDMLAAIRRFAEVAPGDRRALYLQAVLAARAGNADLARSLLQRSGDFDREVPAAIMLLALIDLDNDNPASAAQGFDRLLAAQPDNPRLQGLLARALAAAGNDRELIARFGGNADDRGIALLVGRAYESTGQRDRAAPYLDRAMRVRHARLVPLMPDTPLNVAALGRPADGARAVALVRGLIVAKRTKDARQAADTWLQRHPGSADAMVLAGDAALASGDARGALLQYRRAAAIRRPWPLAKRMAAALEASGDVSGAENIVSRQLASEPNNAEAAVLLAYRYAARGQRGRADLLAAHAAAHGG